MKKILLSAFLCLALSATTTYASEKPVTKKNSKETNKAGKEDEANYTAEATTAVVACWGTFYLCEPGTSKVVRSFAISENTIGNEQDCFDWVAKQTLFWADMYPQYDVISTGALK